MYKRNGFVNQMFVDFVETTLTGVSSH